MRRWQRGQGYFGTKTRRWSMKQLSVPHDACSMRAADFQAGTCGPRGTLWAQPIEQCLSEVEFAWEKVPSTFFGALGGLVCNSR
jgi:hypothetical protein